MSIAWAFSARNWGDKMAQGWIKLHRQILDNPVVCKDADYFAVWCYLLLNATHQNKDAVFAGKKITLHPGQLITGRKSIQEQFGINESKVQRILKFFETEQQIEQQTSNKNRLISIVNWNLYQDIEQQNEQLVNNSCTTDEHQMNNQCTTNEQQVNTNKNERIKECKNEINNSPIEPDWHERFSPAMGEKLDEWLAYKAEKRQKYKPQGLKTLLSKTEKEIAKYGEEAVMDVIDSSMSSGYQGIVWDRLAGSHAGTKTAGYAGAKTSGGPSKPDDGLDDLLAQMYQRGWE